MSKSYSEQMAPGGDIIQVSLSEDALPNGPCKALWVGTAGNINITTVEGNERDDVPAQVGILPIKCTHVRPGASSFAASNIWAIY